MRDARETGQELGQVSRAAAEGLKQAVGGADHECAEREAEGRPAALSDELRELLAFWQRTLRLQDWIVEVQLVHDRELPADALAHVDWDKWRHEAIIKIPTPETYAATREFPSTREYRPEALLLHELLHLTLHAWNPGHGTAEDIALELAINQLAGALLRLKYRTGRQP